MDLGLPVPTVQVMLFGGLSLLIILAMQLLIGYRKIHFKGRTHLKVHKGVAWFMLAVAVVHALAGLVFLRVIN